MISFVWTPSSFWAPPTPLLPSAGGSEAFTVGQARELNRRGIDNQIITFHMGADDGRAASPDVRFVDYASPEAMGRLDGDVVLVIEPLDCHTEKTPFVMMHCPPDPRHPRSMYQKGYANRRLITNSRASADMWGKHLGVDPQTIGLMYPFADAAFARQPVPAERRDGPVRVLFAGRLSVGKGFYTFLEMLHLFAEDKDFEFTIVLAGRHDVEHDIIEQLVHAHPMLHAIASRPTPQSMAELLVTQDVLVMPSHPVMWKEPFGMLSVEAQHAGCRVAASDTGGLTETDCGGLHLFEPGNPLAMATAVRQAAKLGRLSEAERKKAAGCFTVQQSVDQLLALLGDDIPVYCPA